jgi:hypothetical protein
MKRHAPGLYTEGDIAVTTSGCRCAGYCEGKWLARKVDYWVGDWPELGDIIANANSKRELLELLAH